MVEPKPPSLRLPALRDIASLSVSDINECLSYLQILYTPRIRASNISRRIAQHGSVIHWHSARTSSPIDAFISDDFERSYAIRWLNYLACNSDRLQASTEETASITDRAAAILANCGGASSAGVLTRNLDFFSPSLGQFNLSVRDIPLQDGMASVGAQTWGGACVLAEVIVTEPRQFLHSRGAAALRVLELGAGTGMVGMTLAKIAHKLRVPVEVVCTDAYPPALENLAINISSNFSAVSDSCSITSLPLDWSAVANQSLSVPLLPPLDQPFDLVVGADIIYEAEHASWIRLVLTRLLKKQSLFHLVIPLRRTHAAESSTVESVFLDNDVGPRIISKETLVCELDEKSGEEMEYAYYQIGW
uniref:Uncharacterized protein n=1 Tax=Mycena chlorophos TaxID=658473 RepID=A0ABQ0MCI8_MYCCL|nr:predicted protein [Mycena chlorophos]